LNGADLHKAVARKDLTAVVHALNAGYGFALLINFMLSAVINFRVEFSFSLS